jgi:hypothetical protein
MDCMGCRWTQETWVFRQYLAKICLEMSGIVWPSPLYLRTISVPRWGASMARTNLTDAFVKALRCEPERKMIELRDADVRGLELRVTASGAKTWRLLHAPD